MPKKIKLSKGKEAQKFVNDMTMNPDKKDTYKGGNFKKAIDNVEEAAKQTAQDQFKEYKPTEITTKHSDKQNASFNKDLKIRGAEDAGDAVTKYKNNKGKLKNSKSFDMPTFKRTKNATKLLSTKNQELKQKANINNLGNRLGIKSATKVKSGKQAQITGAALLKGKY